MFESTKKAEIWAKCGDDFFYGLEGEKKDYELALNFYEKAMKRKHPRATFMLGLCNELGRGVEKDLEYAEILYEMATEYGDKDAEKRLATGKVMVPPPPERIYECETENDNEDINILDWRMI